MHCRRFLSIRSVVLCLSFGVLSTSRVFEKVGDPHEELSKEIIPGSITLPIDHFNASDHRTYENRYWMIPSFYQPGGPVILYDFGETGVQNAMLNRRPDNHQFQFPPLSLAKTFKGLLICWEHRFYGQSLPFQTNNETGLAEGIGNAYQYLNNEQALEDTVYLARHFKPHHFNETITKQLRPDSTPWIWTGGSYAGTRAAMVRQRNPDVFFASWASSAPVQSLWTGVEYYNAIEEMMPVNCSSDVETAIKYADEMMAKEPSKEKAELESVKNRTLALFTGILGNLSSDFNDTLHEDLEPAGILVYPFLGSTIPVQYAGFSRALGDFCDDIESYWPLEHNGSIIQDSIRQAPNDSIKFVPDVGGINASWGPAAAYQAYVHASVQLLEKQQLLSALNQSRYKLFSTSEADDEAWNWQLCSQEHDFPLANASNPKNIITTLLHSTTWKDHCRQFGSSTPLIPKSNANNKYGGWLMQPSNTMFTEGTEDPWIAHGVFATTNINPFAPNRSSTTEIPKCNEPPPGGKVFGKVFKGHAHGEDLRPVEIERHPDSEEEKKETEESLRPGKEALDLFERALREWLPCFNASKEE